MRGSAIVAVVLCALSVTTSHGIVVRHDVDAVATPAQARKFGAVCKVLPDGEGVLIAPRWILTAEHVATSVPAARLRVRCGGIDYRIAAAFPHPRAEAGLHDIGLLRLAQPVQRVTPLPFESDDGLETGSRIWIVGRGDYGNGEQGVVGNDGKLRVAENALSKLETQRLEVHLDPPQGGALAAEGISGPGDSGTPALAERDGLLHVVGIGSVGRHPKGRRYGQYGSDDVFMRVSAYREWITGVLTAAESPP